MKPFSISKMSISLENNDTESKQPEQEEIKSSKDNADFTAQQKKAAPNRTIFRCPKCRSINPVDAKYCLRCGKVFESEN